MGVGIIVLNKENKIFVAKELIIQKFLANTTGWNDEGEDFLSAAYRN